MPSDPTPTESELRQGELYASTKYSQNDRSHCAARLAYADALAKCRVDADKIRADERERLANIVWDYFNDKWPDGSMHDAQEELNTAIRGGAE